ncbi:MAG: S9 family peptidase [Verrucomicrobiaceae bacterium]|nr:MAG: S9 family peptidase [Verrucomicrobiaceae bacterium]
MYENGAAPRFFAAYGDNRFVNLFRTAVSVSGAVSDATPLTPGHRYDVMEEAYGLLWDISVARDGSTLYFASRPAGSNQGDELPKSIYSVGLSGADRPKPVIADEKQSAYSPRISPDGERLAYLKADGTHYTSPRITVWVLDLVSGSNRQLIGAPDQQLTDLRWSPDGELLYVKALARGSRRIFTLPSRTSGGAGPIPISRSISDYSISSNKIAYISSTLSSSPEITVASLDALGRPLTRSSFSKAGSDRFELGEAIEFNFSGWNNEPVHGFLLKPSSFVDGQKYPVVLSLHGGPNGAFTDAWSDDADAAQLLAARGYAVVMINPHGSSGYGTTFGQSVLGHWGDRPLEDLQRGWSHLSSRYPFLDTDRACVMGGSYGGYLTLLIAGVWNKPWKCLVARAGIFDIRSFYYSNDITAYNKLSFASAPWLDDSYEVQNPVSHVSKWRIPLFVYGGGEDYRVPIEQTIASYAAARLMKVPAQLLYFTDERHNIAKPRNVLRLADETGTWLARWLQAKPVKGTGAARKTPR